MSVGMPSTLELLDGGVILTLTSLRNIVNKGTAAVHSSLSRGRVNLKSFGKDSLQRLLGFTGCGCVGRWWSCVPISIKMQACASHKESKHQHEVVRRWLSGSVLAE